MRSLFVLTFLRFRLTAACHPSDPVVSHPTSRCEHLDAIRSGPAVVLFDDDDRENEETAPLEGRE